MDSLIVYPDGTDRPGVTIPTANGFIARVVSRIADHNLPDAEKVAGILNEHERSLRHTHVAGTTIGKHIDECAKCGHDLRSSIHQPW